MADAPHTHAPRLVIPLFPERAEEQPTSWLAPLHEVLTRVRALLGRVRIPREIRKPVGAISTKVLTFTAPAVLLAGGVAVFTVLAASMAAACGVKDVNAAAVGFTAGAWTFLASTGYGLVKRGWSLAALRWR